MIKKLPLNDLVFVYFLDTFFVGTLSEPQLKELWIEENF
jgi:hypothetical protein